MRHIFESEDELIKLFDDICTVKLEDITKREGPENEMFVLRRDEIILRAKACGLIKESEFENAKKNYYEYLQKNEKNGLMIYGPEIAYIQQLEKKLGEK